MSSGLKPTRKPPKKYHAVVYQTDGTLKEYTEPKAFFTLTWFLQQVGGFIELIPLSNGRSLVVNEGGYDVYLDQRPINKAASQAFPNQAQAYTVFSQGFHGTVIDVPNAIL